MGGLWIFFLGGRGRGRGLARASTAESFSQETRGFKQPHFLCYILLLSSGGFVAACVRPSRTAPDPRFPGQHVLFKLGQLDDPLPHTEDSEGHAAPRSVTDSTEQWVWCIMHMSLCYMLFLLYV